MSGSTAEERPGSSPNLKPGHTDLPEMDKWTAIIHSGELITSSRNGEGSTMRLSLGILLAAVLSCTEGTNNTALAQTDPQIVACYAWRRVPKQTFIQRAADEDHKIMTKLG